MSVEGCEHLGGRGWNEWEQDKGCEPAGRAGKRLRAQTQPWESSHVEQVINSGFLNPGPGFREPQKAPENRASRRVVPLTEISLDLRTVESSGSMKRSCGGEN